MLNKPIIALVAMLFAFVALFSAEAGNLPSVLERIHAQRRHNRHNNNNDSTHPAKPGQKTPYVLAMNRRAADGLLTLHGLWPKQLNCQGPAFDINALDPIRTELDQYWPSFNHDNPTFWKHEYEKHARCWIKMHEDTPTELAFFSTALSLLEKYTPSCDDETKTDCRCDLDENYNLVGVCDQR